MIRRAVCLQTGILDETILAAADWDYILKIPKLMPIAFIETPLLDYRISDSQMSLSKKIIPIKSHLISFVLLKNFN